MRQAAESVKETTADIRRTAIRVYFAADNVSVHQQCSLARIDNSAARAAKKTRSSYSEIGPQDNKMADICVSSTHTNTTFSAITGLNHGKRQMKAEVPNI